AGELAEAVGTSRSAMSQHLRVLVDTGVIDDERLPEDARARQFRLRGEALAGIQAWLDQLQAHWHIQLDAFKRQAERKSR
ncbi:MAG: ArsR/SmtB family transcription factor, partial [Acidimicrobiales bacterium]